MGLEPGTLQCEMLSTTPYSLNIHQQTTKAAMCNKVEEEPGQKHQGRPQQKPSALVSY